MMNWDWFSTLSEQQNEIIVKIIELEKEIKAEKNNDEKAKKEEEVENLRKQLPSQNPHLFYHVLAVRGNSSENAFRSTWQKENIQKELETYQIDEILSPSIDISLLPDFSFFIQFNFTLEKPYISRDEQNFYIIDNPIRKDRVFGLPYVAPSSWKGSLRAALWQRGHKAEDDEIRRIFGNERATEEHERLRAGRLHLFPTFFTKKGLEIINPHDRERRVGINPILMECVPKGVSGLFSLLYVPFDLIGKGDEEIRGQVGKDILLIARGLKTMFRECGFGAKTSSGFGIAKSELTDGKLILKVKGMESGKKEDPKCQPPEEAYKKYLNEDGSVKEEFKGSGESGLLSNKEYNEKGQQSGGGSLAEFKKFRRWYDRFGDKWQKELGLKNSSIDWPIWRFENFNELLEITKEIEKSLIPKEDPQ